MVTLDGPKVYDLSTRCLSFFLIKYMREDCGECIYLFFPSDLLCLISFRSVFLKSKRYSRTFPECYSPHVDFFWSVLRWIHHRVTFGRIRSHDPEKWKEIRRRMREFSFGCTFFFLHSRSWSRPTLALAKPKMKTKIYQIIPAISDLRIFLLHRF